MALIYACYVKFTLLAISFSKRKKRYRLRQACKLAQLFSPSTTNQVIKKKEECPAYQLVQIKNILLKKNKTNC